MPDWKYVDWMRITERALLGLLWFPTFFSLACDIAIGLLFLNHGLAANTRSPHPHPEYRKRWTQLCFGKPSMPGVRLGIRSVVAGLRQPQSV